MKLEAMDHAFINPSEQSTHFTISHLDGNTTILTSLNDDMFQRLAPAVFVLAVVMVVGAIGNIIVCYIFTRKLRKNSQNFLLLCLGVFDLLSSCVGVPSEIFDLRHYYLYESAELCKAMRFLTTFPSLASILVLLVIAVDRYRRICKPLRRQIHVSQARFVITITVIIALIFSIPALYIYGHRSFPTPVPGLSGYDCSVDDTFKDTFLPLVYEGVFLAAFLVLTIVLASIYLRIWLETRRHIRYLKTHAKFGAIFLEETPTTSSINYDNWSAENIFAISHGEGKRTSRKLLHKQHGSRCSLGKCKSVTPDFGESGSRGKSKIKPNNSFNCTASNSVGFRSEPRYSKSESCLVTGRHIDPVVAFSDEVVVKERETIALHVSEEPNELSKECLCYVYHDNSSSTDYDMQFPSPEPGICCSKLETYKKRLSSDSCGDNITHARFKQCNLYHQKKVQQCATSEKLCAPNAGNCHFYIEDEDSASLADLQEKNVAKTSQSSTSGSLEEAGIDSTVQHFVSKNNFSKRICCNHPHVVHVGDVEYKDKSHCLSKPTDLKNKLGKYLNKNLVTYDPACVNFSNSKSNQIFSLEASCKCCQSREVGLVSGQSYDKYSNTHGYHRFVTYRDMGKHELERYRHANNKTLCCKCVVNICHSCFRQTLCSKPGKNIHCSRRALDSGHDCQTFKESCTSLDRYKRAKFQHEQNDSLCSCHTETHITAHSNEDSDFIAHTTAQSNDDSEFTAHATAHSNEYSDFKQTENGLFSTKCTSLSPLMTSRVQSRAVNHSKSCASALTAKRVRKSLRATRTTVIAFAITTGFILSYLPHLVLIILRSVKNDFEHHFDDSSLIFYNIFLRSYFANNVINVFVYGTMNLEFRSHILNVWRRLKCSDN